MIGVQQTMREIDGDQSFLHKAFFLLQLAQLRPLDRGGTSKRPFQSHWLFPVESKTRISWVLEFMVGHTVEMVHSTARYIATTPSPFDCSN